MREGWDEKYPRLQRYWEITWLWQKKKLINAWRDKVNNVEPLRLRVNTHLLKYHMGRDVNLGLGLIFFIKTKSN